MDTIELLTKFSDPETMQSLTTMQRLMAGLVTTILGMGITFVSLVALQFVIGIMAKLQPEAKPVAVLPEEEPVVQEVSATQDEELVAAITTVLAMQLKTSVSNIVIRNIQRVGDSSSAWQRAGISEHMNNSM